MTPKVLVQAIEKEGVAIQHGGETKRTGLGVKQELNSELGGHQR